MSFLNFPLGSNASGKSSLTRPAWYAWMFPVNLPSPFQPAPAAASPLLPTLGVGSASSMPSDVAENLHGTRSGLGPLTRDYNRRPVMITNPRLAPSTVTTEQAFQARNL